MPGKDTQKILHGNLAKIEKKDDLLLPQGYRAASEPKQYGFESLPGSPEDLKKARQENQDGKKDGEPHM